ncbi:MAG: acyl-ACP desaturase [Gemmataceae bacterium]|nr:acyl-ACP desaturase [Gemmataceae bacterium]
MSASESYGPALEREIWHIYREFFDLAERRRRWNLRDDIPWDRCNPATSPAVADVVESFCAVELFLPDYVGKFLPLVRGTRGRAWFAANWGYEESKHSLALQEWLVKSGHRTEEQIEEVQSWAVIGEWHLPTDNVRGLACYTMAQELATWLHYRNLRKTLNGSDPALDKVLGLLAIDERAHYDFYVKVMRLHLRDDREGTIEQVRRVLNGFAMPATHLLADSRRRIEAVRSMNLFNEDLFYSEVMLPILDALGVEKRELKNRAAQKKSLPVPSA